MTVLLHFVIDGGKVVSECAPNEEATSVNESLRLKKDGTPCKIQKAPDIRYTCAGCGKEFTARPRSGGRKYCSHTCLGVAQQGNGAWQWKRSGQTRAMLTCEVCGKEFFKGAAVTRIGGGRFCSTGCSGKGFTGPSNPNWNSMQHTCVYCGKEFWRNPTEIKLGSNKHCSLACLHKDRAENYTVKLVCQTCAKPFTRMLHKAPKQGTNVFCSMSCTAKWKSAHAEGAYSRAVGGRRADLDNRYFRSRWEANWARYLNYLVKTKVIASWEYEVDTFEFANIKRGVRFYTPDFKITRLDGSVVYHEIKGWMDAKSKTKLARMKKYHPAVRIEIYGQKEYAAMAKQYKAVLPGWEADKHDGGKKEAAA